MKLPLVPHITEKSYGAAGSEVAADVAYTFMMNGRHTKTEVAKLIAKQYSVTVVDVRTVTLPRKLKTVRGVKGQTSIRRKAIVRLAAGQKIEGFIQDSPKADNV